MAIEHGTRPAVAPAEREADWLRDLRGQWRSRLEATPAPSGQEEEWRRTSLDGLPWDARVAAVPASGTFDLPPHLAERGVVFGDLARVARERPELVQRFLGRRETLPAQAHFWALAHAEWQSGTFLYVPRGVEIDETLLARVDAGSGAASFPVSLVIAEEGSSVTLLEEIRSDDGVGTWFGGVSDIVAGPGSRVRYASLQRLGDAAWNVGAQRVEVESGRAHHRVNPRGYTLAHVLGSGLGGGEVDDHVRVLEDARERRVERRVGATHELHVLSGFDRRADGLPHPPRGARYRDPDQRTTHMLLAVPTCTHEANLLPLGSGTALTPLRGLR
jgi:hypothetical protein